MRRIVAILALAASAAAADRVVTPFASVREVFQQFAPPELKQSDARAFEKWAKEKDAAIRSRLAQGDLDSMVNLLLFGTSFTAQPRMTIDNLGAETRAGLLKARLDDLLAAIANPGSNERIAFVRTMVAGKNAGPFILENLQRVLKEKIDINARLAAQGTSENVFSTRGVSLDTTILPNYAIDAALGDLKTRGLLPGVSRAAVVGPGLDFIDKESGFDYYPLQTLQPFAVYDSLRKLGFSANPRITILDISPRVLNHVASLRTRTGYTIQLPRNAAAPWAPGALEYWRTFGPEAVDPIPTALPGVATRAARFPIPAMEAVDLNIVSQQLQLSPAEKYDLVVATNILVYYDPFEQALALANVATMLKPGGFLLVNDALPTVPSVPMKLVGRTEVMYSAQPRTQDTIFWYQRGQ